MFRKEQKRFARSLSVYITGTIGYKWIQSFHILLGCEKIFHVVSSISMLLVDKLFNMMSSFAQPINAQAFNVMWILF